MVTELKVNIDRKKAGALLDAVDRVAGPRRRALMEVLGKTHERTSQDHFQAKNNRPNKRGWPKQNFWASVRSSTSFRSASENTATIAVGEPGFRSHLFGATIRPRSGRRFLAIPMRAAAYGIMPSSGIIPDLFFIRSRAANGGFLARREGGALRVYYRLLASVTIPRDPTALPPEQTSIENLTRAALLFLRREIQRAN